MVLTDSLIAYTGDYGGKPCTNMTEHKGNPDTIKSLESGLAILKKLNQDGGQTASDIAESMDVSVSTAYRYLNTLFQEEFLVRRNGEYRISLLFLQFSRNARAEYEGLEMVQRKVEELAEETGERAQFMVPEFDFAVCLCHAMGEKAVRLNLQIGDRNPLHTVSHGKVILAHRSAEEVEQYLRNELMAITSETITDPEALRDEIAETRERGYGLSDEEYMNNIHAVAVPVTRQDGSLYGAIGVAGPSHRMDEDRIQGEIVDLLEGTASEITLNLEYSA